MMTKMTQLRSGQLYGPNRFGLSDPWQWWHLSPTLFLTWASQLMMDNDYDNDRARQRPRPMMITTKTDADRWRYDDKTDNDNNPWWRPPSTALGDALPPLTATMMTHDPTTMATNWKWRRHFSQLTWSLRPLSLLAHRFCTLRLTYDDDDDNHRGRRPMIPIMASTTADPIGDRDDHHIDFRHLRRWWPRWPTTLPLWGLNLDLMTFNDNDDFIARERWHLMTTDFPRRGIWPDLRSSLNWKGGIIPLTASLSGGTGLTTTVLPFWPNELDCSSPQLGDWP
jgi:hypothetical protein